MSGSNGDIDKEDRLWTWQLGEERKGGMYGESNMDVYITVCKVGNQQEFAA